MEKNTKYSLDYATRSIVKKFKKPKGYYKLVSLWKTHILVCSKKIIKNLEKNILFRTPGTRGRGGSPVRWSDTIRAQMKPVAETATKVKTLKIITFSLGKYGREGLSH